MFTTARPDAAAIAASVLCLVHCLVLPLVVALLPAASHFLSLPEGVHIALFVLAAPVSAYAVIVGYGRHGLWLPAILAGTGLVLLACGAIGGLPMLFEVGVSVTGSLLLVLGHVINLRERRIGVSRRQR